MLAALGQAESPENAHAVLLKLGYWDDSFNPYPLRAGVGWGAPMSTIGLVALIQAKNRCEHCLSEL